MLSRAIRSTAERGRRTGALALLVALVFTVVTAAPPHASAEERESAMPRTWHATAIVRGDIGLRVVDYWSRGPDMRARTVMKGHPITTIVVDGRYIVYDELTGKGLDIGRSPRAIAEDADRVRPFGFELDEVKLEGGERVEELVFGSRRGEIWQVTDARGRRKVWVTVGTPQVPLRVETFDRKTAAKIDLDYQNWVFDLELSDRFFSPPAGTTLESFEYDDFMQRALDGRIGAVPILYPDLLHGQPPG